MTNKRLYEVAKDYNISSNALLKILRDLKHKPKSHMSVATDDMLRAVRIKFASEKAALKKDIEQKKIKAKQKPRPPQKQPPQKKPQQKKSQDQTSPRPMQPREAPKTATAATKPVDKTVQKPAMGQQDNFAKKKKKRDKKKAS